MLARGAISALSASLGQLSLRAASRAQPIASSSRVQLTPRAVTFPARSFSASAPASVTINQVARGCRKTIKRKTKVPLLEGCYQKKGVVSKVYTTKPRKPNSAVRKVIRVKLSTGKSTIAYLPGERHNLQEHHVVLIRGGRTKDLRGVRYKAIRGALDFNGVAGRTKARSKYGVKKPKAP